MFMPSDSVELTLGNINSDANIQSILCKTRAGFGYARRTFILH
jgi:hypothetical protein